jgi:hypothetical protein
MHLRTFDAWPDSEGLQRPCGVGALLDGPGFSDEEGNIAILLFVEETSWANDKSRVPAVDVCLPRAYYSRFAHLDFSLRGALPQRGWSVG